MAENDDQGFYDPFAEKVVQMPRRRFRLRPFKSLVPKREPQYLVKGLIPRVGLVVVWGPPKCGKSFWTSDLMLHVALGWKYRGHRVRQGSVVYCAFEGGDGFNARAEAFRLQHQGEGVLDPPFYLIDAVVDLVADHAQLISDIRTQCAAPAAVILDTLNRSLVGSESSDEDMAKYVRAADVIRFTFNCVVIVVHHCGINETRPRGHTSLTGAADAQLAVKRDEGHNVVVTVEWMKEGPEGEVLRSSLDQVELGLDTDGDAITSCVVTAVEASGSSFRKKNVSKTATIALRLLADAILDVGSVPSPHARIPANTRTCPDNQWREYCFAGTLSDSDKPDSKSKAFRRAKDELQVAGLIGVWRDQVWLVGQAGQDRT